MADLVPLAAEIAHEGRQKLTNNVIPTISSAPETPRTSETCCICLSHIDSETRAVATPCLHACFDFSCLVTWLEGSQSTCPVCKQPVEKVKYNFKTNGTGFQKYQVKPPSTVSTSKSQPNRNPHRRVESRRYNPYTTTASSSNGPADDILRRRFIYKNRLRSLHIGVNRKSRFANYTPKSIRTDPELLSKAKAFVRRELEVFEWTESNREWLVEYIVAIVKSVNLRGAEGKAEDLLEEFLGREFAGVFVHELNAYLKSPFVRVRDYDNWAQYQIEVPKDLKGLDLRVTNE